MAENAENAARRHTSSVCGVLLALALSSPLQAVVVSELHYHPPEGQEALEFLEITNDAYSPEDISGWAFVEGIRFEFPPGTILKGREALVVCANVDAVRAQYRIDNAVGNYEGKLDGSGDRVTLVNHVGIVMQSLRYRDGGKWPVGPDGTGHSLSLKSLNLNTSEPESWAQSPELGGSPGLPNQPALEQTIFFNELFRSASQDGGWVEIYNAGADARDVSGWGLTDDPDRDDPHVFPAGTTIPPGGFLVVEEQQTTLTLSAARVQLFLLNTQGVTEAAVAFDREPVDGLALGDYSEALFPDGNFPGGGFLDSGERWVTPTPTRGRANDVPRVTDLVINEIFYHPPEDRDGEFLELFNRGTEALDLSGFRFTKGIDHTFPAGTSLQPGAYLVLADDPQILAEHYGYSGALGWSGGALSDGGENLQIVDRRGNLVDEVRYFESGDWSLWADGRGASLELIDPQQDNDFASAWAASDQPEKSVWEEHSFVVPEYAGSESELRLLLVERGISRIDDVSVEDSPPGTDNFIPNPGFEEDTLPWLFEGTHVESERITHDAHSGQASLELVASGKGDTRCNRIETGTEPALTRGSAYEVSLWTRWLRGSSVLVVSGEFSSGSTVLSVNAISAALRMTVPRDLGTPGAENSVRLALRRETGSDNLGPVTADVAHSPAAPAPGLPVTVRARVSDSDGVASVRVFFREDVRDPGPFQSVELLEVSEISGDDTYGGAIPALSEIQVAFYVESTDALGAVTRLPTEAPESTLLYRTEGPVSEPLHVFLGQKSFRALAIRSVQSNHLLEGTVVLDDEQVHYGVGVRYRGSALAGRVQDPGIRVRFPDDRRLKQRLRDINLSRRDRTDGAAYFLVGRNGTAEKPTAVTDYKFIRTRFTGNPFGIPTFGNVGIFEPVDRDFIEKWYGADAARDGVVLKGVARSRFDDSCKITASDPTDWRHRGENPENYRFYWFHGINQTRDDWQPLVDVTRILDASETRQREFLQLFDSVVDVEGFLRGFMPRVLMNDIDALLLSGVHNGYIFWEPTDARWSYLAFDLGGCWRSQVEDLLLIRDEGVLRFLQRPGPLRLYYGMIHEYLQGYWSAEVAGPFLDALEEAVGIGAAQKSFIAKSQPRLEAMLEPLLTPELRILTNNGEDLVTETPAVELTGDAPVFLTSFQLRKNDGAPQPFEPTWSTPTEWLATVSLSGGANRLEIFAFDAGDAPAGTVTITITRPGESAFIRGDANGDQSVNVIDAIATIGFLFQGLPLSCPDAADVDDNGTVNVTDAVSALEYLVSQGPAPLEPFPGAGVDPTQDLMECVE